MLVKDLTCKNFRNLDIDIKDFSVSMNVVCGENAQGKTNLIEALWLFTGAKSFRQGPESGFIRFGEEKGVVKCGFESEGVVNTAKIEFGERRVAYFNEKALSNPSKLAGRFNAVIFTPDDVGIIKDGPEKRRRFLDVNIGQIYPQYVDILRDYLRAVKQRNEIIKNLRYDATAAIMLDSFEQTIAACGEKIMKYRADHLTLLSEKAADIYKGLSNGREEIKMLYAAKCPAGELEKWLKDSRREDAFNGSTSAGPHRDDVEITINGESARLYGSQGQKRSAALALKLACAEVIKNKTGEYPVCLLDDVMSELDENRQNYVLNHISGWQSFITCCDPGAVSRLREGKIIEIKGGEEA